jgi:hypothetical protein
MVAKVDKQQVAVVAPAMDPSRQADGFADVAEAQLGAGVGTIGVHDQVGSLRGNFVEKVAPRFTAANLFVNPRGRG